MGSLLGIFARAVQVTSVLELVRFRLVAATRMLSMPGNFQIAVISTEGSFLISTRLGKLMYLGYSYSG